MVALEIAFAGNGSRVTPLESAAGLDIGPALLTLMARDANSVAHSLAPGNVNFLGHAQATRLSQELLGAGFASAADVIDELVAKGCLEVMYVVVRPDTARVR